MLMPEFHALEQLPRETINDRITRRVLSGEKGMMVWWSIKAGAHAAAHHHPHEQMFWVLSGRMEFRAGDEKRSCGPGDVGVVPGGVEHEAWFSEDTEVIDFFAPPREDLRAGAGAPAYMRKA